MTSKAVFGFSTRRKTKAVFLLILLLGGLIIYRYTKRELPVSSLIELDWAIQTKIDSLKSLPKARTIYPFNPNYISDQRAYFLGLSLEEINRLHAYRAKGKWVNSIKEFQQVTHVNQSWLDLYSPYFTLPKARRSNLGDAALKVNLPPIDLNSAAPKDFQEIRGIGEVLGKRIVNYRTRLNGYSLIAQLDEVYGLKPEVLSALKLRCTLITPANIQKISLQNASLDELASLPYLSYSEARKLLSFRTREGKLTWSNLKSVEDFDSLKIKRLALYLY